MSRLTRLSGWAPTSRNLHNVFLQNELRNHKKKLTERMSRRTRPRTKGIESTGTARSRSRTDRIGERVALALSSRDIQRRTRKDRIITDSRSRLPVPQEYCSEGQEGVIDEMDLEQRAHEADRPVGIGDDDRGRGNRRWLRSRPNARARPTVVETQDQDSASKGIYAEGPRRAHTNGAKRPDESWRRAAGDVDSHRSPR